MLLPVLILPLLAAATQSPDPNPVFVTGHAWAPFISPMGEPFRAHSVGDNTLANWFRGADRNHDGVLTVDEMQADAERFFATLDTDHDGEIDPDELINYEWEVAPDIQVNARTRRQPGEVRAKTQRSDADRARGDDDQLGEGGGRERHRGRSDSLQGAARYALLNIPEPVAAADTNFDRGISLSEFRQAAAARFQLLDSGHQGKLTLAQLEELLPAATATDRARKRGDKDTRVGNALPPGD